MAKYIINKGRDSVIKVTADYMIPGAEWVQFFERSEGSTPVYVIATGRVSTVEKEGVAE